MNQRVKTTDKAGAFRFFTTEQLGARQSLTPEGFLLCENVPIARTGQQMYSSDEIPVEGIGGRVTVYRDPADVFRAETIASFEGKSVTIDHPDDWVTPGNWKTLTHGVTQNVRRGGAGEEDLLVADLLITDENAITKVRGGLREVSCGYDADYEQTAPGVGYQRNIVGNHVALVERGRAGPRCSIKDKETDMATKKPTSWADKMFALFAAGGTKDRATWDEAIKGLETADEGEEEDVDKKKDGKTADSLAALTRTVDTLVKTVDALTKAKSKDAGDEPPFKKKEGETEDDDTDPDGMTVDMILTAEAAGKIDIGKTWTGKMGDSMKDIASRAEILVPGFKIPTTDAVKSLGAALRIQCKVLDSEAAQKYVAPLLAGRSLDSMKSADIRGLFHAASEMAKAMNNSLGARAHAATRDFGRAPASPTDINAKNAEFWAKRNGT